MKKLILVGGGGHCRSCIDVIESTKEFKIIGILDEGLARGDSIYEYKCIGNDMDIAELSSKDYYFLVCIGQIYSSAIREKCFSLIKKYNGKLATVISPRAWVAKGATIGEGTIIMHDALVNAGAAIGTNCIINTKSLIEHDAIIDNNCHISTGAIVNGGARVGSSSFVGSGSVLVQSSIVPKGYFVKALSIYVSK
ncbi:MULTISPECIES: NeuD/PglB/VioB family sugar acetyltransferase [unclassified Pseudoalteromonas]|jgi:sugar O-acyltransferase (sialic acid O-acetyltransferase NeuD family)|uniref:NeuD/PglB/VioB family sugar acetyltransferase n=1 Tax=unclassified Pseudoalteromonas TaxID=194690 RepID=UPI001C0075DA|nr:NeuD/PglB/VioB family sugar acetyltransferase [Pseudoalteromonas sp. SiA1]QWF33142.1 NeuD/PglB/VioB family sugar acetyltransferase [Pseudoalteromonas sp. SiA1]